ncbi:MAG: hypothetical protein B6D54_06110 [Epsilonproteobacteria bacterium 4484_65]|nr:MAG: hypothetical protein B6D54_06110 [Epsilonproteobacteria bacterium 4484_65]
MGVFVKFKKPTIKEVVKRLIKLEEEVGKIKPEVMSAVEQELNTRTKQLQDLLAEVVALVALLKKKGFITQEEIKKWLVEKKNG